MITTIVFDMGNVLLYFKPEAFLDRTGMQWPDRELLMKAIFASPNWGKLDSGEYDEADVFAEAKKQLPERLHAVAEQMIFAWDQPVLPVPGMQELVANLKKNGYRILLLSNASRRQHDYWPQIPGSEFFDGTLISADVRMVKPESRIYQCLYEKFSLDPAECVFVDDAAQNVQGAIQTGMQAIRFENDADSLRRQLRALGVRI